MIRLHPIWIPNFSTVQLKIYFKEKNISPIQSIRKRNSSLDRVHQYSQFEEFRSVFWKIKGSFWFYRKLSVFLLSFLIIFFDWNFGFCLLIIIFFGNDRLWFNSFANLREKKTFHIILCLSYLCDQSELVDLIVFEIFISFFSLTKSCLDHVLIAYFHVFNLCLLSFKKKKQKNFIEWTFLKISENFNFISSQWIQIKPNLVQSTSFWYLNDAACFIKEENSIAHLRLII